MRSRRTLGEGLVIVGLGAAPVAQSLPAGTGEAAEHPGGD